MAVEDDLLEARQVFSGDESGPRRRLVRGSRRLRRWPPGRRSSIDEDDLPARSAEPVLGPEVEVAGRARQGLADAVEPLPMGVSNTTPSRSVGGKLSRTTGCCHASSSSSRSTPPASQSVLAQETPTQPGDRRRRPTGEEGSLGAAGWPPPGRGGCWVYTA